MGEKGPLVERVDTFERKQHCNVPYAQTFR